MIYSHKFKPLKKNNLNIDYPKSFKIFSQELDKYLLNYINFQTKQYAYLGKDFKQIVTALLEFSLAGGRRLRPTFIYIGWLIGSTSSNKIPKLLLQLSVAYELLHTGTLIHDDIIDNSTVRRNIPTINHKFSQIHTELEGKLNADDFGKSTALLIGDLALAWSDHLFNICISKINKIKIKKQLIELWSVVRTEIQVGQFLDLFNQNTGIESYSAAMKVAELKTASYTVSKPIILGAILSNVKSADLKKLENFGNLFGIAFQLHDDLQGIFGDNHLIGKPVGDDLRFGKRTVLIAIAIAELNKQNSTQAKYFRKYFGKPLEDNLLHELTNLIKNSNTITLVKKEITEKLTQALTILKQIDMHFQLKLEIEKLTTSLIETNLHDN